MASGSISTLAAGVCYVASAVAHGRGPQGARIGTWLGSSGCALLAGGLVARGVQAAHWPLTSLYEFTLAFSLGTALAGLLLTARYPHPAARAGSMTIAAALLAYAHLGMPASQRLIQPLAPALDSIWLPLHVGVAALGYGALAVAGSAGFSWLVDRSDRALAGSLLDRAVAAGYPLLTLSMILGMIWAQTAWGRYWDWDLKETWTLLAWLVYTLYWHLRGRRRWRGARLAWLALGGFAAVLFTFLGVSWLAREVGLESLHLF